MCGISEMPHRSTFNRFLTRLSNHQDLVDQALAALTNQLKAALPGFGEKIAIDSTTIRTHSSPNRPLISDPEASWTAKTHGGNQNSKEWYFGYKQHMAVDATYGLPIVQYTTTARRSDSPELPKLLEKAASTHDWFAPTHVMADRGYDAMTNYTTAQKIGAIPIIAIRSLPKKQLREGIYTDNGVPTCVGKLPMDYVRSDPAQGHLYQCPPTGCHLKGRKGMANCLDQVWENRKDNPRLFGPIRRGSQEWRDLYGLRQSVERTFKSLKQSRCLESHCIRGLKKISLHATLSTLSLQATAVHRLLAGQVKHIRWQVREVA